MGLSGSRGIQRADVWAAAERILGRGEKPTVERVRHDIGRGSPNTVTPMLDEWFAMLPARLRPLDGNEGAAGLDDTPLSVRIAIRNIWDEAKNLANAHDEQRLQVARQAIEREKAELEDQESDLYQREVAFVGSKAAFDVALASAQRNNEDLRNDLRASKEEMARLQSVLTESQAQIKMLLMEHATALAERDGAAGALEKRHAERERRLFAEIDRAREESSLQLQREIDSHADTRKVLALLQRTITAGHLSAQSPVTDQTEKPTRSAP